jgi:energy-coupling factor transport system ATP-binding protein
LIALKDVSFSYEGRRALDGVSLTIKKGEHVAVIGPNASGKSTLARVMNALLIPEGGDCIVDGVNTRDEPGHARKAVGMVFQDPDSQVVARRVADDVAFGPTNLGLPEEEVQRRVAKCLGAVGMKALMGREVAGLSGGEKQLLAIAGVLAMGPSYIVLDEPTAFLDAKGTEAVDSVIARLKEAWAGVVVVTHDMGEALQADRVVVLYDGRIVADASPSDIFSDVELLNVIGVEPPYTFKLMCSGDDYLIRELCRGCR